jgi:Mg2+ and Co2+ transporter CorA
LAKKDDKYNLTKKVKYKQIQAGQDWSDPYTWYGLVLALSMIAPAIYVLYIG